MNKQTLNNIKMYLDFLLQQINIDYTENTEEQYDENIWFFYNQYMKIFDVLHDALETYNVDIKTLLNDKYVIEHCSTMYKELNLYVKQ